MITLLIILLAPSVAWGWIATIWHIIDFFKNEDEEYY